MGRAERESDPIPGNISADRVDSEQDESFVSIDIGSPIRTYRYNEFGGNEDEAASPPVPPKTAVSVDAEANAMAQGTDPDSVTPRIDDIEVEREPRRAFELERTSFELREEKDVSETTQSAKETDRLLKVSNRAIKAGDDDDKAWKDEKLVASIQYYDRVKQMLMYWNTYRNSTTGEMRQTRTVG